MTKILEKNVAEIIVIGIILMILLSSCSQKKCTIAPNTWASVECENCDEVD